jgi:gamma-glutamyl hercynylcysteine S-oxide synthase
MTTNVAADATLLDRLREARAETDALFKIVRPEFLYDRPIAERHRLVFYIGHLEAFDWNLLKDHLKLKSFNPDLDRLFAFGIDPVEGNLPTDEPGDWPSLATIYEYRDRIRATLDAAIEDAPIQLLHVAMEHRMMHAETLAYLFHQMDLEKKTAPLIKQAHIRTAPFAPANVTIPAGRATLGLSPELFGWDNEFDEHTVDVPEFKIGKFKVTNRQFLEFVGAGGYFRSSLWTHEDWAWRDTNSISHPAFWKRQGDHWLWRSMFEEVELPLDWPVYVSHAEARAYAKWAHGALPTEEQWHRAAHGTHFDEEPIANDFDPRPVHASRSKPSAFGVEGLIANGWEWTSTVFGPFRGFRSFPFYPGYSEPFFDGKHYVLKGGSPRTAASMLRPSFRNWFQPHYQYVYAGFRCVFPANKEK